MDGQHSATVVITHGLGDSSEGYIEMCWLWKFQCQLKLYFWCDFCVCRFADVAEMFSSQMPYTKFILPTAPTQPVTLNGGMAMNSWYDIVGLDDRASETCDGIHQSR